MNIVCMIFVWIKLNINLALLSFLTDFEGARAVLPTYYYTVTSQKFKYTVIFYLNTMLCLPLFICLILLNESLFNASKIGVMKYI